MSDGPESIVPRDLRRLEDRFDKQDERLVELMSEIRAAKLHQASVVQTDLAQDAAMTNLRSRMDQVERRHDLSEAPK
ncbi:MAG: hypothetical protein AAF646_13800 [Pseudomonadota bacterium]